MIKEFGEEFVQFCPCYHLQNISHLLIGYRLVTMLYDFLAKIIFFKLMLYFSNKFCIQRLSLFTRQ